MRAAQSTAHVTDWPAGYGWQIKTEGLICGYGSVRCISDFESGSRKSKIRKAADLGIGERNGSPCAQRSELIERMITLMSVLERKMSA